MQEWLTSDRIWFLLGFPGVMLLMFYLSVLLGLKFQSAWINSLLYRVLSKGPRFLRLGSAVAVGAVTPFCSCTTVPGFIAILEAGLGMDTALAFLFASPTLDPVGLVILIWLMGLKFALIYFLGCCLGSLILGGLLGRFFGRDDVNPIFMLSLTCNADQSPGWREAARGAGRFVVRLWWIILLSTLVGFLILNYVPAEAMSSLSAEFGTLAIPMAAALGLLVYAHMSILVPVGAALVAKGLAPGIVLAFLVASAGISPPEMIILRKLLSLRLLIAFICTSWLLISLLGFVVNWMIR